MYKIKLLIMFVAIFAIFGAYSCDDGSLSHDDVYIPDPVEETDEDDGISAEPTTTAVIQLQVGPEYEHQVIDGFGCAFGGWMNSTYCHMQRDAAMEELFGETGLRLNICRGAVFEDYINQETGEFDFGMDRNFNLPPDYPPIINHPDRWVVANHLGQMWSTDYLLKKHPQVKHFYSTWCPPFEEWKNSNGYFNMDYAQNFTDYLLEFIKGYKNRLGLDMYAISPTNEPDSPKMQWGACGWKEADLAKFIHEYLRPAMNKEGFNDVKIIVGEAAIWSSSIKYAANVLAAEPELVNDNIIAAGHGYWASESTIKPYSEYEKQGIPVWLTETCDNLSFDNSWGNAMKWAGQIHTYLSVANLNAFVWWAGARGTPTGESILQYETSTGQWFDYPSLTHWRATKYYAIGQYSRYIPTGSTRVEAIAIPSEENTFPANLQVSAYVKEDVYTMVIVNKSTSESFTTLFGVNDESLDFQNMVSYTSSSNLQLFRKKLNPSESGKRYITVPAYSIVTVTGKLKNKE